MFSIYINSYISYIARSSLKGRLPALFRIIVAGVSLIPPMIAAASGTKVETLPIEKAAPAAVAIETAGSEAELRRLMRVKNGVNPLQMGTERFSEAPMGSYGFIAPSGLGLALITQSPDLLLQRTPSAANDYEIHKLSDGSGMLVGFMAKDIVPEVIPNERPKTIRISVYSNSVEKAPIIVALPIIKLMADRIPVRIDSQKPESAMMLEMDLQSTANRKSPLGR
jgi:hypothetical protein